MVFMTQTTRPYEDPDADELTRLLHRAYATHGDQGLNFTAVDQDVEVTRQRVRGGGSWVTTQADKIVGALTISYPPEGDVQELSQEARAPGRAWLHQLAVDPTCRGTGLARTLWTVGRTWAAEAGATHIGLDTATPAQELVAMYQNWGFRSTETIQFAGKTYASTVMVLDLV